MDVCWILAGLGLIFGIAKFLFSEFEVEEANEVAAGDHYYNPSRSNEITNMYHQLHDD